MPVFLRQEDHKLKAVLGYIARSCFRKERKKRKRREGEKKRRRERKKRNQKARTAA